MKTFQLFQIPPRQYQKHNNQVQNCTVAGTLIGGFPGDLFEAPDFMANTIRPLSYVFNDFVHLLMQSHVPLFIHGSRPSAVEQEIAEFFVCWWEEKNERKRPKQPNYIKSLPAIKISVTAENQQKAKRTQRVVLIAR